MNDTFRSTMFVVSHWIFWADSMGIVSSLTNSAHVSLALLCALSLWWYARDWLGKLVTNLDSNHCFRIPSMPKFSKYLHLSAEVIENGKNTWSLIWPNICESMHGALYTHKKWSTPLHGSFHSSAVLLFLFMARRADQRNCCFLVVVYATAFFAIGHTKSVCVCGRKRERKRDWEYLIVHSHSTKQCIMAIADVSGALSFFLANVYDVVLLGPFSSACCTHFSVRRALIIWCRVIHSYINS